MATIAQLEVKYTSTGYANVNQELNNVTKSGITAESSFSKLGGTITSVGAIALKAGTVIGVALGALSAGALKVASDANETASKFSVVFSTIQTQAEQSAKVLSDSYGLSSNASKKLLSDTGDLLTGFGFTQQSALELSTEVQKLAVDLASFTNFEGGAKGASEALTKALLGERESVKALGIAILEEDVQNKVLQLSKQGITFETERQAKAYATLLIAQEQSKNAIGDFARTSDQFANQVRIVTGELHDQAVVFGTELIPAASRATKDFREFIKSMSETDEIKNAGSALGDFIDELRLASKEVLPSASDAIYAFIEGLNVLKLIINTLGIIFNNFFIIIESVAWGALQLSGALADVAVSGIRLAQSTGLATDGMIKFADYMQASADKARLMADGLENRVSNNLKSIGVLASRTADNIADLATSYDDYMAKVSQSRKAHEDATKEMRLASGEHKNLATATNATTSSTKTASKEAEKYAKKLKELNAELALTESLAQFEFGADMFSFEKDAILMEFDDLGYQSASAFSESFSDAISEITIKQPVAITSPITGQNTSFGAISGTLVDGTEKATRDVSRELQTYQGIIYGSMSTQTDTINNAFNDLNALVENGNISQDEAYNALNMLTEEFRLQNEADKQAELIDEVQNVASAVGENVGGSVGIMADVLSGDWAGAVSKGISLMAANNPKFAETLARINDVFGKVFAILADALTPVIEVIASILEGLEPVFVAIGEILKPIGEFIGKIFMELTDALQPVFELIADLLEPVAPLLEIIFDAVEPIADLISELAGIIKSVGDIGGNITGGVGDLLGGVVSSVGSVFDGFGFADGGISSGFPTGVFSSPVTNGRDIAGEAGAEAIIPLKGGAVPVTMKNNDNTAIVVELAYIRQLLYAIDKSNAEIVNFNNQITKGQRTIQVNQVEL